MPLRFPESVGPSLEAAGRICIGSALVGFGVQQFLYKGDFAGVELLPPWLLTRPLAAWPVGILLMAGAVDIAFTRRARVISIVLAVLFLLSLLLFAQGAIARIGADIADRTNVVEMITIGAGFLILGASMPAGDRTSSRGRNALRIAGIAGRICFAVSMAVFGWSHMVIPQFIASFIPAWIPAHLFLAYFTGIVFLAAAPAIAFRLFMRAASFSVGLMLLLWVFILHAPRVANFNNRDEWNSLLVALILSGFSFVLAGSPETVPAAAFSIPDEPYAEEPMPRPGPQRVA